jgi:hypothetical protein
VKPKGMDFILSLRTSDAPDVRIAAPTTLKLAAPFSPQIFRGNSLHPSKYNNLYD